MTTGILFLFFLGWITYSFSLFDVGPYSFTLLLLASIGLGLFGLRLHRAFLLAMVCLVASGFLAVGVAIADLPTTKTLTHTLQYLICLGVVQGAASVDWERHFGSLRRGLLILALVVFSFGIYQALARGGGLPFAFLPVTNLQLGSDEGLQRGYGRSSSGGSFLRVSSFFAEPSDMGRFMLWILALGYVCRNRSQKLLLMFIAMGGILISQSMGGLVGAVVLVGAAAVLRRDVRGLGLGVAAMAIVFPVLLYVFPQVTETVVSRAVTIWCDREAYLLDTGRFVDLSYQIETVLDAPLLGHGMASVEQVASSQIVSVGYILLLIERGLVGTFLFLAPFVWALCRLALSRTSYEDETKHTAILLLVVELYCLFTFSSQYFSPLYFALGFALAAAHSRASFSKNDADSPANSQRSPTCEAGCPVQSPLISSGPHARRDASRKVRT